VETLDDIRIEMGDKEPSVPIPNLSTKLVEMKIFKDGKKKNALDFKQDKVHDMLLNP